MKNQIVAKHRLKRQTYVDTLGICPFFPGFDISQDSLIQLQKVLTQCISIYSDLLGQELGGYCISCIDSIQEQVQKNPNCEFPDLSTAQSCAYDLVCIFQKPKLTLSTQDDCSAYSTQLQQSLVSYSAWLNTTNSTTIQPAPTTESIIEIVQRNAPTIAGTVGGIGAVTFLIQPPTLLVTPQGIPPGNPLPGTPGIFVL